MKTAAFLTSLFLVATVHAASMITPEAILKFESADGKPIAGVALSAMLGYSVIVMEDCTGFICMPSLPHRVRKSEGGQVLGFTDANGQLKVESMEWSTSKLTAKDLSVNYFTNGTVDVTCAQGEDSKFAGFVHLLPESVDGNLTERNIECFNLVYKKGDSKNIEIKCISPLTMEQIQQSISTIKSTCG